MPDPKRHDQPAEGGEEVVEHTLQKQEKQQENAKGNKQKRDGNVSQNHDNNIAHKSAS